MSFAKIRMKTEEEIKEVMEGVEMPQEIETIDFSKNFITEELLRYSVDILSK